MSFNSLIIGEGFYQGKAGHISKPLNCTAVVIDWIPTASELHSLFSASKYSLVIIPQCSVYSHFYTYMLRSGFKILSTPNPVALVGRHLMLDLDKKLLIVDGKEIRSLQDSSFEGELEAGNFEFWGEVSTYDEIENCKSLGIKHIGVIKSECLLENKPILNLSDFVSSIVTRFSNNKVYLRYFDPSFDEIMKVSGIATDPLGYRGIRINQISKFWLKKFRDLIQDIDTDDIVVILPFITSSDEISEFREQLGVSNLKLGVTIETPAAVLNAEEIISMSDFVEIGLNDLSQYTLAWNRDIPDQIKLPTDHINNAVLKQLVDVVNLCKLKHVPYVLGLDLNPSIMLQAQLLHNGITAISSSCYVLKKWTS